jgi:hypothetical protein
MFSGDSDNYPDLGDEQFGSCYDRSDCTPSYDTSSSFSIKTICVPLSWFTMTDEQLIAKFKADAIAWKQKLEEEKRLRRIKELEEELAKLKNK